MRYSQYLVHDDRIEFSFYEFYFSSLRKKPVLAVDRIIEMDFNTYPCSMEIDDGEIVFFNHRDEDRIKAFAERNRISIAHKIDVWEYLCQEFLDTEFDDEIVQRNQDVLLSLGFTPNELRSIKKRIKWTLRGTWEWTYLGHWDLLAMKQYRSPFYRINGRDFYRWTMEVAARGKEAKG